VKRRFAWLPTDLGETAVKSSTLMGGLSVVDCDGGRCTFERSKSVQLIA
jgi:hypothetical protein